jgi:hypothetical protein
VTRRDEYLRALAEQEELRAQEAIRVGDSAAADRALERARKLRRIAYLRVAAAAYQGNPSLNPEQVTEDDDATGRSRERSCSPASGKL